MVRIDSIVENNGPRGISIASLELRATTWIINCQLFYSSLNTRFSCLRKSETLKLELENKCFMNVPDYLSMKQKPHPLSLHHLSGMLDLQLFPDDWGSRILTDSLDSEFTMLSSVPIDFSQNHIKAQTIWIKTGVICSSIGCQPATTLLAFYVTNHDQIF